MNRPKQFGFDLSALQIGDILLTADSSKKSMVIARATKGLYSHAMLYVGKSAIHAMLDGVYSKNPQRTVSGAPEHLAAFRVVPELLPLNFEVICDTARVQVGALYTIPEAGVSALLRSSSLSTFSTKQFCSRLVAQCYSAGGIELVANKNFCSPNDLAKSPKLFKVPGAVCELNQQQIDFASSPDFNVHLHKFTFEWLGKVRDLARRRGLGLISNQNDVGAMLVKHPGYDKVVSRYIEQSGYADYYAIDRLRNGYRYDVEQFLHRYEGYAHIEAVLEAEEDSATYDLERHGKNFNAALGNYEAFKLDYFMVTLHLARNLLEEAQTRKTTIEEVRRRLALN